MAFGNYNYGGGYPATGGYYAPPMPDNLAQLRGTQMPPMQQPMIGPPVQPIQSQQAPAQPINNNMIWVQGETGAKSFLVANGNTVPLWDSENQTVYIKTVDASGMPSMRVLDYVERVQAPRTPAAAQSVQQVEYVTRTEFDALAAELSALKARKCACAKKAIKEDAEDE